MADYQYVSRGEVDTFDFTLSDQDIYADTTWRDLDLDSIISDSGPVLVHVRVTFKDNQGTGKKARLRQNANTGTCCNTVVRTHEAGVAVEGDLLVMTDSDNKIEYNIQSGADEWNLVVRGWWTSPDDN